MSIHGSLVVALVSVLAARSASAERIVAAAQASDPPRSETTFVSTNPVGLYIGQIAVSVSQAVHERVALRGDAILIDNNVLRGYSASLGLTVYVADVFDGPFVEPGFMARRGRGKFLCDGSAMCGAESLTGPQLMVGWHWTFGPGVSIAVAVGAIYDLGEHSDFMVDPDNGLAPTGYVNTGVAF